LDKKFWFQLLGLAFVILVATFLVFNRQMLLPLTGQFVRPTSQTASNQSLKVLKIIDSQGNLKAALNIEIADTSEKRSKGLGYRESLATDSGMLFIHERPQKYTYWMKGMNFPIDIMWVLDDEIVDFIENVPPPVEGQTDETLERYSSITEVNKVLETNAGFASELGIRPGDKIVLEENP
jgi:uncharacterized protein